MPDEIPEPLFDIEAEALSGIFSGTIDAAVANAIVIGQASSYRAGGIGEGVFTRLDNEHSDPKGPYEKGKSGKHGPSAGHISMIRNHANKFVDGEEKPNPAHFAFTTKFPLTIKSGDMAVDNSDIFEVISQVNSPLIAGCQINEGTLEISTVDALQDVMEEAFKRSGKNVTIESDKDGTIKFWLMEGEITKDPWKNGDQNEWKMEQEVQIHIDPKASLKGNIKEFEQTNAITIKHEGVMESASIQETLHNFFKKDSDYEFVEMKKGKDPDGNDTDLLILQSKDLTKYGIKQLYGFDLNSIRPLETIELGRPLTEEQKKFLSAEEEEQKEKLATLPEEIQKIIIAVSKDTHDARVNCYLQSDPKEGFKPIWVKGKYDKELNRIKRTTSDSDWFYADLPPELLAEFNDIEKFYEPIDTANPINREKLKAHIEEILKKKPELYQKIFDLSLRKLDPSLLKNPPMTDDKIDTLLTIQLEKIKLKNPDIQTLDDLKYNIVHSFRQKIAEATVNRYSINPHAAEQLSTVMSNFIDPKQTALHASEGNNRVGENIQRERIFTVFKDKSDPTKIQKILTNGTKQYTDLLLGKLKDKEGNSVNYDIATHGARVNVKWFLEEKEVWFPVIEKILEAGLYLSGPLKEGGKSLRQEVVNYITDEKKEFQESWLPGVIKLIAQGHCFSEEFTKQVISEINKNGFDKNLCFYINEMAKQGYEFNDSITSTMQNYILHNNVPFEKCWFDKIQDIPITFSREFAQQREKTGHLVNSSLEAVLKDNSRAVGVSTTDLKEKFNTAKSKSKSKSKSESKLNPHRGP